MDPHPRSSTEYLDIVLYPCIFTHFIVTFLFHAFIEASLYMGTFFVFSRIFYFTHFFDAFHHSSSHDPRILADVKRRSRMN